MERWRGSREVEPDHRAATLGFRRLDLRWAPPISGSMTIGSGLFLIAAGAILNGR
ncbi:MAG TPA: hypothetical protein VG325_18310 [Solirubrobacteraceae bacterium]|jgi:hypothetical protein|nr:hypothetical protein [Solirubrobacteraceae bacterium]